jgi:hypothetical protein
MLYLVIVVKVIFSNHAKERLKQREIPSHKVVSTVRNSEKVLISFRARKLFRKRFGDKMLEVIAVEENSVFEVITAYYLEE